MAFRRLDLENQNKILKDFEFVSKSEKTPSTMAEWFEFLL